MLGRYIAQCKVFVKMSPLPNRCVTCLVAKGGSSSSNLVCFQIGFERREEALRLTL